LFPEAASIIILIAAIFPADNVRAAFAQIIFQLPGIYFEKEIVGVNYMSGLIQNENFFVQLIYERGKRMTDIADARSSIQGQQIFFYGVANKESGVAVQQVYPRGGVPA
jgi:hypothetical protein